MNKPVSRTPPRGSQEVQPPGGGPTPVEPEPPSVPSDPPIEPVVTPPAEPQPHEYSHPLLKGRGPEEIERLFQMQENAMKEQGAQLTGLVGEVRDLKTSVTAPATPAQPDPTAQEYFADPVKAIRAELDRQIQPLREEIADAKSLATAPLIRDKLAQEFPDWATVEPYVDMLIAREQFPDPNNEGLLRTLYFTAKGLMTHQGIEMTQPVAPLATPIPGQPVAPVAPAPTLMVPPQHRASSPPPPPPPAPTQTQVRDLTENEKRLAREYGMTAEEYVKWQEADMDAIAESEIGIPEEKPSA